MVLIGKIHIVGDWVPEMGMSLTLSSVRNTKPGSRVTSGLESILIVCCYPHQNKGTECEWRSWCWEDMQKMKDHRTKISVFVYPERPGLLSCFVDSIP